jgi:glycerol-3-phosphate dehydrogenase
MFATSCSLAAIMRNGLVEMKNFGQEFFADVKGETFLQESAGVADLITSCLGGRNRKVAEAFVKEGKVGRPVIVQSMVVKLTRSEHSLSTS